MRDLHSDVPSPNSPEPNDSVPTPRKISRRQFGRNAAIATAASLGVPAFLTAESAAAAPAAEAATFHESLLSPPQEKKGDPLKGLTPQQVADLQAKHANILRKYGSRFNDAQKQHLIRILAQQERLLAPVRAFAVQNGDPPASVLRLRFDRVSSSASDRSSD